VQLPAPEGPEFTLLPPLQIYAEPNKSIILEAEAKGNPVPEMSLYHNGLLMSTDQYHLVEIAPDSGRIRLQIYNVQSFDEGEWTIVAKNTVGSVSKIIHILPT
jgi:hypothetical protein